MILISVFCPFYGADFICPKSYERDWEFERMQHPQLSTSSSVFGTWTDDHIPDV